MPINFFSTPPCKVASHTHIFTYIYVHTYVCMDRCTWFSLLFVNFGLRLNNIKHCSEVVSRLRLLSGVSKRGTHRADSFLMPKISCRIWLTRSFDMPTVSAVSRIFNRRSANTRSWTFVTLSTVVAVFGAPGRGSSKPTCNHVETR